jgi:hypothetical protein
MNFKIYRSIQGITIINNVPPSVINANGSVNIPFSKTMM